MTRTLLLTLIIAISILGAGGVVYAHSEKVTEKYENAVNPVEVTEKTLETGKNIYAQRCAVCHGSDGKGANPGMPDLTDHAMMEEMGESTMFQKITEGVPGTPMSAWEDVLTEEERWMVINYINTMHHGEEGPHETGTRSEAQSFAAAPEKGLCGPTGVLLLTALPIMYWALRRRK